MEMHRANPGCAGCHARDGSASDSRWRTTTASANGAPKDGGSTIDASGKLPDGTEFNGPAGLKKAADHCPPRRIRTQPSIEKFLTYALGRGLEYYDQPAVRAILRQCDAGNYRLRDLITAVVMSTPFQMRRSPDQ